MNERRRTSGGDGVPSLPERLHTTPTRLPRHNPTRARDNSSKNFHKQMRAFRIHRPSDSRHQLQQANEMSSVTTNTTIEQSEMCTEDILTPEYFLSNQNLQSWLPYLQDEFSRPYIRHLREFLHLESMVNVDMEDPNLVIYPEFNRIFAALKAIRLCNIKVVIIGQDPYHNGRADGLSFSMLDGQGFYKSSLKTIFEAVNLDLRIMNLRERINPRRRMNLLRIVNLRRRIDFRRRTNLRRKIGFHIQRIPLDGTVHNLAPWADQGVLLLNSVLTVRSGCAKSHYFHGWEQFTDRIVEIISQHRDHVVFLLWGNEAKNKRVMIDNRRHQILFAPHPSYKKSRKEFITSNHFDKANEYLIKHRQNEINWLIST